MRGVARSAEEFEAACQGLPILLRPDLDAEVVCIEPVNADYFRSERKQRCIVRRKDGRLYVSTYD